MLGTFSQYGVIHQNSAVKVDDDLPLDKAVLVGCGVPTGWGSAVNTANVSPGDTVAVFGIGGIGINAVQGARYAGAKNVIAIDPLENKREKAMELGATHAFATAEEAIAAITDLTRGQMADSAILTVDLMTAEVVANGFNTVGKGGTVVLTGLNKLMEQTIELPGTILTLYRKTDEGQLVRRLQPDHRHSRRSSACIRAAISSSTRSSPARTPLSRSTRATTICSTARTCAA